MILNKASLYNSRLTLGDDVQATAIVTNYLSAAKKHGIVSAHFQKFSFGV